MVCIVGVLLVTAAGTLALVFFVLGLTLADCSSSAGECL